ncbi:laminin G [Streptomyces sp. ICC4]|nr:laminin G [Streptomyces sp. ICC4]
MRIARPSVVVIAFVMAVLAGTEQAALAANQWVVAAKGSGAGERPGQAWGSARGRSHDASGNVTGAAAGGGRSGAQKAPGELPADGGSLQIELGTEPKPPAPVPFTTVPAPVVPEPKGFDSNASTEVTTERAERARTFLNKDGTYTTRFYNEPVNFLAPDGKWNVIDARLTKPAGARTMSVGGAGWETQSTQDVVRFAEYADAESLAILGMSGTVSIGYGIEGAAHSAGTVDGSVITYPEVRKSSDVVLIAGSDSVKETLILKDKSAPTQWRFPLALNGLTAKLDGLGGIAFTDAAGKQQGWMPAGWMEDSKRAENSNEGVISSGVTYTLETSGNRQILVATLDAQWLSAPERVFPVKVDPSVTGVSSTSGTYVEHPYNQNFASDTNIKAGTYDGGGHKAAGFLKFDGLGSGAMKNGYVVAAKLSLYNTWSSSCTARPVTVHQITSNWSESSTSAWPGPATGPALGSKSFAHGWRPDGTNTWSCGPAWEGIPLGPDGRQLVDDWTHNRKPNYGLAVKASDTDSKSWKNFGSDDYPNGAPSLDVTWTSYGAVYQAGGFVQPMTATSEGRFKATVTNQGQATWSKNANYKLRYDLFDANNNLINRNGDWSKVRWTDMPQDVPPGGSVTVDAAIAPLTPGTYTLVWTMDDYGSTSFVDQGVPGMPIRVDAVNIPPYLTGAAPPSGSLSDTLTPTLWISAEDKDRYPSALTYTFEVCEVEGADTRKNCRQSPAAPSQSWAVPAGWLSWSKTYAWYGYANDGQAQSAQTQPSILTPQVPQPAITSHLGGSDSSHGFGERAGNYTTAATDAAVPVVGPDLAVTRTYNSQDPRQNNAFGTGWATRWDMRAKAEADGNVVITLAAGSQIRFGRNNDGTYSAPSGSMGVLTAVTGGWTLRDASGALYTFDTAGLLTKAADGNGREQLLTYTGGLLTKATDALSKRALTFTWSVGRVSSVSTDAIGPGSPALKWTYTYSNGRLAKVCPPTSTTACTLYEYTAGSQYRSTVLDANPVSYWRLNESEGENAQSDAVSRTGLNAGRYRDVTLASAGAMTGTGNKAATFNGTNSYMELPEAALSASKVLSLELWFKTAKPGVLVGFQDKRITDGKPYMWNPALVVDTTGKLRGGFELAGEWKAPISSTVTVTDGAWHHAVLTSSGTGETLYLDGQAVGSRTGTVDHSAKTFAYLGGGFSSVAWDGNAAQEVRYFNGSMDDVAVYHRALDAGTVRAHYDARTGTSKLSKSILPSGRTGAQVTYDNDTERATQVTDESGGTWKISPPQYSSGSQAYTTAVQATGPVNYWRLGDSSGAAAADEISSGGNGSYHDGVTLGSVGTFLDGDNGSVTLDGTKGAVDVPAETIGGATALAAEMWFRTDKPNGVLLGLQNTDLATTPTQWNPSLLIDADGKLRGELWRGIKGTSITSTNPVTDNAWHHVVLTGGTTGQTMYLDGVKVGYQAGAVTPQTVVQAYLGAGYSHWAWDGQPAGVRYFSGQLDEAAFYGKELDAATVADHYKARTRLVAGTGNQYQGTVMADAPTSYWQLDETTGTRVTNKITASGGNGTYTKTKLNTTGAFGIGDRTAAEFTGDGYARLPGAGIIPDTDLSVELWFKTTKPGVLLSNQESQLPNPSVNWTPVLYVGSDNKLHGQYFTVGSTATNTSPATVTDDQWHHAVVTAKGSTQTLYLDGTQVAEATNVPVHHQANNYTYIGAGYAGNWPASPGNLSYFTGQLDEVAVYPSPLTGEQVAKHYNARTRASGSSLTATVTVTDPMGAKTSSTYDAVRGQRRTATTNPDGGVTTYAYDTGGFLHTVTDPNGHATVTGHDERGNTVSTTTCRDDDSCWTSFIDYYYNAADLLDPRNGKPTAIRDARSAGLADNRYRTTTSYTPLGLTDTVTLADGRTSATTYTTGTEPATGGGTTPAGLVATKKSPGGATASYVYFASGDLAKSTAPSGLATTYTYDGLGRKLAETQTSDATPTGVTTTYTYNAMSRVASETGPGVKNEITGTTHTAAVNRTYDPDGLLLTESTQDTTGGDTTRTTTYQYNAQGLNEKVTDPVGNVTAFAHDPMGRVVQETDAAGNVVTHSFTKRGNLAESVLKNWTGDPAGQTRDLVLVSHAYDPAGRLASTTDPMGATTTFTYFDDGRKAKTTAKAVTQADGTTHDIVLEANDYDGAGNLTSQTTGGGRTTVTNTVDATGRTTRTVLDPNGLNRITATSYNSDDQVTEATQSIDGTGKKLTATTEYDIAGNPKKATVTDGITTRTSTATFDQRGLPLTEVSPRGNTTTNRYDALGRLVEQTAPQVQAEENGAAATAVTPKTLTGYNTFAEATDTRDARGMVTRTETDKLGRATAVTLPDYTPPGGTKITGVARTSYDQLGNPASQTDPLGRATYFTYDQLGNLTSKTDPALTGTTALQAPGTNTLNGAATALSGGGVSTYSWTPTGLQLSVTDPTGSRNEATYDQLGRNLTSTIVERKPTLKNLVSRYTWDDASNQTISKSPAGRTTTATHNTAGEVLTVTDPLGGITKSAYDGLGRTTETTDATGRKTTTAYNVLGQPTATTDFGTGTTALRTASSEYDADGNVTASTSATGSRRTYTYDALGRMTKQIEPVTATDSITTTFGYDAASNRTRLTDGRGKATYYTFTPWGLPESTIEPATTQHWTPDVRTWTTSYDAAGQPVSELLPGNVKRQRTYDALGRLTGETGSGTAVATRPRTLSYDLAGRMTGSGTDSVLAANTYTYNDRGQLLNSDGPSGKSAYTYDADGNMASRTDAAGTTAFTYDTGGRLDTSTDPLTGTQVRSDYDAAGRPTVEQYARPATGGTYTISANRTYSYDSLGRLNKDTVTRTAGGDVQGQAYDYDLSDQLVKKTTTGTAGAAANTYTYDLAGRMTSWNDGTTNTPYEWDKAGNLTKRGAFTGTYDARNRLETWGTETYAYSARGSEKTITDSADANATQQIQSDAFERTITNGTSTFTYDSLDRVLTHNTKPFTYDGGSNNLVTDATTSYTRTPAGSVLSTATTGQTGTARLAVTDQHDDLVASLTPDGSALAGSRNYDPFGKTTATSGANPNIGYQSGWTDPSTDEVNMAARWYQPGIGSFTSRDTWQLDPNPSVQANRYTYANASPLNGTDPTGHQSTDQLERKAAGQRAASAAADRVSLPRFTKTYGSFGWSKRLPGWLKYGGYYQTVSIAGPSVGASPWTMPRQMCNHWMCGTGSAPSVVGIIGDAASGSRGGGPCRTRCALPYSPPGDGDPNKDKYPPIITPVHVPEIDTDAIDDARWTEDDGWQAVFGSSDFLKFFEDGPGFNPDGDISADYGLGLHLTVDQATEGSFGSSPVDRGGCKKGNSAIYYAPLDALGRAQGARACLNKGDYNYLDDKMNWKFDTQETNLVGTGTEFPFDRNSGWNNQPRGWGPGRGLQRGHLIAKSLGGSGEDARNLVPLYNKSNSPDMASYERDLARRVEGGETIYYSVTPKYVGTNPIPVRVYLGWIGDREGAGFAIIENYQH